MFDLRNSSTLYVDQKRGKDRLLSGLLPQEDKYGNGPYKSLEYAFTVIKNLRATGFERPMTIALCEDYYVDRPIVIPKDVTDVTIESHIGKKRIIGGFEITGWKKDTFNGVGCLSADLDPDRPHFTDLYVNGNRADVPRYPKSGTLKAAMTEENRKEYKGELLGNSKWFIARREDLEGIKGVEDAIVNYFHFWIDEQSAIESFDPETMKITMRCASRFTLTTLYETRERSDMYYFLSGIASSFEDQGHWYLDRSASKVYYIPRDGENETNVEVFAPLTDKLLIIKGRDIRIRDLEFTVTSCEYESNTMFGGDPDTGLPVVGEKVYGGDGQSVASAPGAISIQSTKRVTISNCHIHSLGIYAVSIEAGCNHIRIENNIIEDVAAGGIKIFGGKFGCPEEYHVSDCFIIGNEIKNIGRIYEAGCGILIIHAHDNIIENNEISYGGYSGISVGWVWGYADNETYGNIIRGNHIHHLGYGTLSDMGGIYLLGRQHGTVVSENRIHHVDCENYGAWGIYLDEGTTAVTVENNVVYDTKRECFDIHYGSHNVVKNNIFVGTSGYFPIRTSKNELLSEIVFEKNVIVSCGSSIYNPESGSNTFGARSNFVFDASGKDVVMFKNRVGDDIDLEKWQGVYHMDPDTQVVDPELLSIEKRDFTPSDNSPIYKMGFKKIPQSVTKPKV